MLNISVFVSGSGTNLQAIINAIDSGNLPQVKIHSVIANRNCKALERAEKHNIPFFIIDKKEDFTSQINQWILNEVDLIVLAGFLQIIPEDFFPFWMNKIINIHPSLLPKYGGKGMYGKYVHQAVIANGDKESGATVHYVTSGIDEGEIILQKSIPIKKGENADWLAVKIHEIEHPLLIEAIKKINNFNYI